MIHYFVLVARNLFLHSLDPKQKWALPKEATHCSHTTLRAELVKISTKITSHGKRPGSAACLSLASGRSQNLLDGLNERSHRTGAWPNRFLEC
jgi:hypothetical protein